MIARLSNTIPLYKPSNTIYLLIILLNLFLCYKSKAQLSDSEDFIVVLDAGHGGKDNGASGSSSKEKHIALAVVKKIGAILKRKKNFKIIYTRTDDRFIELYKRGEIANKAKADLFVSIHCNSLGLKSKNRHHTRGTETYILGFDKNEKNFDVVKQENKVVFMENDYNSHYEDINAISTSISTSFAQNEYAQQSLSLAGRIEDNFATQAKRKSRGVKQANFVVLHQTFMPSVLVELGFLSNPKEEKELKSKSIQQKVATAIAKSIVTYKDEIHAKYDFTLKRAKKTKKSKSKSKTTQTEISNNERKIDAHFSIQIAAGRNEIKIKPKYFKELDKVYSIFKNKIYRYYYTKEQSYRKANIALKKAQKSGYKDAFMVGFIEGRKVSASKARDYINSKL